MNETNCDNKIIDCVTKVSDLLKNIAKYPMHLPFSKTEFLIAQAEFFICYSTWLELRLGTNFVLNFHVPGHEFFFSKFLIFKYTLGTRKLGIYKRSNG